MKKPYAFLMQEEITPKEEIVALVSENINFTFSRINLPERLVIPRYGLLPFIKEFYRDIEYQGSKVINSIEQHNYIANFEYYKDIEHLTPKTFYSLQDLPNDKEFVVKCVTNSKKNLWNTHMYAKNKKEAMDITFKLQEDKYLQNQEVIYREFIKLEAPEIGINGLPFSNEWRFFIYNGSIIDYGYYWSIAESKGLIDNKAFILINQCIQAVGQNCSFYVIDIAKTVSGEWIVIELNDGCQSGLSDIDSKSFYSKFIKLLYKNSKVIF